MVRWWDIQIQKGIALTKMRIAHHEKHGNGSVVLKEKAQLARQEKHKKDRRDNN